MTNTIVPAPVAEQRVHLAEHPEQRLREKGQDAVVRDPVQFRTRRIELVLKLRADEQLLGQRSALPFGHGGGRPKRAQHELRGTVGFHGEVIRRVVRRHHGADEVMLDRGDPVAIRHVDVEVAVFIARQLQFAVFGAVAIRGAVRRKVLRVRGDE
ncbi:MAG: hypothetical protein WDO56_23310 [Gammaproteobacteria bacterium]